MRRVFIPLLLCFCAITTYAQTENEYEEGAWVLKGVAGINLSQTAVKNWAAGGENSLAGNAYLNGTLLRKSGNWLWQNNLILEYGLSKTESNGVRKINDNINFSTQLGYTTNNKWFYTIMGDFKTQFYKGYNYPDKTNYISKFFAPAYSNISTGMEYRPQANYSIYLSPISGKMTFVTDDYLSDLGAFGVDPGDKFKMEMGAYLKGRMEQTIMENVKLISTLDLFTAYDKSFGNIDVNWDVMISMKINKFLSATLNTTLKYDDDVKSVNDDGTLGGPKVQFKEILGVGLTYNF
ncbi:DUF3078 domain-containing protein [Bacteroides sp. 519]|uniref:DUF3078 domain-containing protein n=1 Tax=Bacteroides sp. 519 TaxID=2302937 RepID=UPI0013D83E07|nr:DUF3078 domain-containing protein [Bacteroides sp. 519]NDV60068.1 DUF3078 domain-containing protein [Bacteroides sp. 519]